MVLAQKYKHRLGAIMNHELGHHLHFGLTKKLNIPMDLQDFLDPTGAKIPGSDFREISRYADANIAEGFAEAYSAKRLGGLDPENPLYNLINQAQAIVNGRPVQGQIAREAPGLRQQLLEDVANELPSYQRRLPNASMFNGRRHSSARYGLPVRSSATGRFR